MSRIRIGTKIWFAEEKRPYKVRAFNNDFTILTKRFNLKNTVLYCIIDNKKNKRGSDNMIFCSGYESDDDCKARLIELISGEIELSRRRSIDCHITKIEY